MPDDPQPPTSPWPYGAQPPTEPTPEDKAALPGELPPGWPAAAESDASFVDAEQQLAPGAIVERTYFDPYRGAGGEDVTVRGIVTSVGDEGVRVALLNETDPLPADELTEL